MIRGLYTAASGMKAQQYKMDAVSNNMANADLNGYKKDVSTFKSFPSLLIRKVDNNGNFPLPFGTTNKAPLVGKLGMGVEYNESFTIFAQGPLKGTGNPFDLTLDNKGFFAVETPNGERYTRNGAFTMSKEGYLVTKQGFLVMGENGPIEVQQNNFKVDIKGNVIHNPKFAGETDDLVTDRENSWTEEEVIDTLKVVNFENDRYLQKEGNSLWRSNEISGDAEMVYAQDRPGVRAGFVEGSNVNVVDEMVSLIQVNRAYEANQKTIQTQDGLLDKLINQTARY